MTQNKKHHYITYIAIALLLISSCNISNKNEELLNFPRDFHLNSEIPHLIIDSVKSTEFKNQYYISLIFCLQYLTIAEGILEIKDNKFYITLKNPESNCFIIFDLNLPVGKPFNSKIYFHNQKDKIEKSISIILQQKFIDVSSNRNVYMFIIKEFY